MRHLEFGARKQAMAIIAGVILAACGAPTDDSPTHQPDESAGVSAVENFAENLQLALIEAEPGSTLSLPAGEFRLTNGLSLDVDGVTIKGAGEDVTILDFSGQTGAGEGLLITSDGVTLTGFTIRDTKGDGIKSKGADRIIYRDLTVEWTGEPDESNGAYGVYPVESTDVLVDDVTVRGASDAGIYVGQSSNIIVRNSLTEYNVAGIEIENSTHADVHDNITRHNAGGILVFDLPDLPVIGGHSTRIFDNQIIDNNTRNFAPAGNIVASVPSGTGLIVMANQNVHAFDNTFRDNRTAHVLITAYSDPFEDERYNPLPRDIVLRDNAYENGGYSPQGDLLPLSLLVGGTLPDVVADGVTRWAEGEDQALNLVIGEDESVSYLSLGVGAYPIDPLALNLSTDRPDAQPVEEPAPVSLPHIQE